MTSLPKRGSAARITSSLESTSAKQLLPTATGWKQPDYTPPMDGHVDDIKTIDRKIQLKRQAVRIIQDEIRSLRLRKALLTEKSRLERMITDRFDPDLSLQIDGIIGILEN